MPRKIVSLSNELDLLMGTIRGARILTEKWNEAPFGIGVDPELPRAISATLAILMARVDLLDRAARGTIDPRLVWRPENAAIEDEGAEVQLPAWSDEQAAREAKREWRRCRRRLRSKRQRA